jgi:hypothetical protein
MRRLLRRSLLVLLMTTVVYLSALMYPQPLFAYEIRHGGLSIHTTEPIPDAMHATLSRALARLQRSPLFARAGAVHVFICQDQRTFALFARQNYRVGGVADWLVGQHAFLRESDVYNDRLISPSGTPVSADRPLSYFVAHEAMHIAITRHVGRARYSQLPQWLDDGYADYIARDIDYPETLRRMKAGDRELDPARSGLYLRFQLMVAYLLERKGVAIEALLANPPDRTSLEAELMNLAQW